MPLTQFQNSLRLLAQMLKDTADPWWIFGGGAMALHGYPVDRINDIDVIVSVADAERLAAKHGLENLADGGTEKFRSKWLLHPDFGDIPVELLAGFEICADGRWRSVMPDSRVAKDIGGARVFVPNTSELAEIFTQCGRPKDLVRAEILHA